MLYVLESLLIDASWKNYKIHSSFWRRSGQFFNYNLLGMSRVDQFPCGPQFKLRKEEQ